MLDSADWQAAYFGLALVLYSGGHWITGSVALVITALSIWAEAQ